MSENLTIKFRNMFVPFNRIVSEENRERFEVQIHDHRKNVAIWGTFLGLTIWLISFSFDPFVYPDNIEEIWTIRFVYLIGGALGLCFLYPFKMFSPFQLITINVTTISIVISAIIIELNDPSSPYIMAYLVAMSPMAIIMNLKVWEVVTLLFLICGIYNVSAIFFIEAPYDYRLGVSLVIHSFIIGTYAWVSSRVFTLLGYSNLLTQIDNESKTQSIEKQHIELKQLDNAKTELLSNISHEFRTPLTLILSPIDSLEEDLSNKKLTQEYLSVAKREGLRLLRLVNNLLDSISLLNKGDYNQLNKTNVLSVSYHLRELSQSFSLLASAKNINFDFKDTTDGTVKTMFDEVAFDKVTSNLLMNAVKYTNQGSITLVLEVKQGNVVIKVIDTGIGITSDDNDKIFERFITGSNAKNSGAGIGLSLVKILVESHDGSIKIEANLPKGTIATIIIPETDSLPSVINKNKNEDDFFDSLNKQANRNIIQEKALPQSTGQYVHSVIVVDDEINMRGFLFSIFDDQFNVYTAESAFDALEIMKNKKVDLAILDYMLPDMDGIQLNIEIKKRFPDTKSIMLTANQEKNVKNKALDAGVDDFFVKPFQRNKLLSSASTLLNCPIIIEKPKSIIQIDEPIEVLIIENNQDIANLIGNKFGDKCRINLAYSLKESTEYLEKNTPDIITIDIGMPEGSGLDYIKSYKNDSIKLDQTRLIGISGEVSTEIKFEALKVCNDFIQKPFNLIELELRLKNHVDNLQLNRKLQAQNNRLNENQDILVQREKVAVLGELSMSYMHEIKNPLNYSLSAIQYLKKMGKEKLSMAEVNEVLDDIETGLTQINTITSNLKNYSYKEVGNKREKTNLETVIEKSISFVKRNLKDSGVDVQVICPGIIINASENEIIQIFVNLLNNSISALQIKNNEKNILINASTKGDNVEILFSDNGPGVNESETHKLYEKFYSTKGKSEGTGLGLSISRTIIEGHGGKMEYVGNGPGAIFKIVLPALTTNDDNSSSPLKGKVKSER